MTKETFFELFDKQRPSVKLFYERLESIPSETKEKYLMNTSGFSVLKCTIEDKEFVICIFHLLMSNKGNVKSSFEHISFFINLFFDIDMKISTLKKHIRQYRFVPETFFEVAEYVGIYW